MCVCIVLDWAGGCAKVMLHLDADNGILNFDACVQLDTSIDYYNFYNMELSGATLKLFHINIRSIHKNFDELLVFLHSFILQLDFIVLSECWLRSGGEGRV